LAADLNVKTYNKGDKKMISDKMKDLVKNGSAIRAMFEEGKEMSAKYGSENVFDFSLGNPSIVPPKIIKETIINILNTQPEMVIHGYMSNSGYEDVRRQTAESINRKQGTNFTQENIIMTVGAAGAINIALKTILNKGDEVILFAPYFGEYDNYISNYDGKSIVISPNTKDFSINFDEVEKKITSKTKAVIINSPNNPTGAVYSENDIIRLSKVLTNKQKQFNSVIYIISDEPYREVVFDNTDVPYISKYYSNTLIGYSYSKTLSLPGERIGYLVVPNEVDNFEEMIGALNVANRILGYVNAPSLFQKVVGICADKTADLTVYEKNKNILYNALTEYGYECVEPKGTFYLFPKCFIEDDKEFCKIAKEYRLIVVPGSTFACPGYFRIAFCVDEEKILKSLEQFKKLAERFFKQK